jgi:hypothetical protein
MPYIFTVDKRTTLIPGHWNSTKLYEHNDVKVIATSTTNVPEDGDFFAKLHTQKNGMETRLTTTLEMKLKSIGVFTKVDVYKGDTLMKTVNILHDDANQTSTTGLYSFVNGCHYTPMKLRTFNIELDCGNCLLVRVDTYWDSAVNLELLFSETTFDGYSGEFFGHHEDNRIIH